MQTWGCVAPGDLWYDSLKTARAPNLIIAVMHHELRGTWRYVRYFSPRLSRVIVFPVIVTDLVEGYVYTTR